MTFYGLRVFGLSSGSTFLTTYTKNDATTVETIHGVRSSPRIFDLGTEKSIS